MLKGSTETAKLIFKWFVVQNKPVMVFGLVTITLCVGYLGYLHATKENNQQLYEAIDSEGERYMRRKTSKWDWWHNMAPGDSVCSHTVKTEWKKILSGLKLIFSQCSD